jgi:hypothetical protein
MLAQRGAHRKVMPLTGPSESAENPGVFSAGYAAANCGRSGAAARRSNPKFRRRIVQRHNAPFAINRSYNGTKFLRAIAPCDLNDSSDPLWGLS